MDPLQVHGSHSLVTPTKCICPKGKIYLSKVQNAFVQSAKLSKRQYVLVQKAKNSFQSCNTVFFLQLGFVIINIELKAKT